VDGLDYILTILLVAVMIIAALSAVARSQETDNLYVDQIGYFAGNEVKFAFLFQQYQAMNQKMI
jgi:hypothetical protein